LGAWTAEIPIHAPQKGPCDTGRSLGFASALPYVYSGGPTKPPMKRKDFPMNGPVTGMYLNRTALQYGRHRRSLFIGGEKDAGMD